MNHTPRQEYCPVIIIGAGESGLAMGCQLERKLGFDQFKIFDRQSGIGGTWWINRYPGVACDVPSALYSFSFSPFYTSKQLYPSGSEMLEYFHRIATSYDLLGKFRLNTDVTELRWVDSAHEWEISLSSLVQGIGDLTENDRKQKVTAQGRDAVYVDHFKLRAKVVVSCVGILVEPNAWPTSIPGREISNGDVFHCARWRDEVDFHDKDVVVLGSGCSAAQVVPSLLNAPFDVKSVTQTMRTTPWMKPRLTEPVGLFLLVERIWKTVFQQKNVKWRGAIERSSLERMRAVIPKKYHKIMTPGYGYGCKRRVFDDDWLQSMNKPNFHLTTRPLKSLLPDGAVHGPSANAQNEEIKTATSNTDAQLQADIIILANGYEATRWFHPLKVYGRDGTSIHDVWAERGGAQAYMGTAMDGFPNVFIAAGPYTANGHASIILGAENIVGYILEKAGPVLDGDAAFVEPKKEVEMQRTKNI